MNQRLTSTRTPMHSEASTHLCPSFPYLLLSFSLFFCVWFFFHALNLCASGYQGKAVLDQLINSFFFFGFSWSLSLSFSVSVSVSLSLWGWPLRQAWVRVSKVVSEQKSVVLFCKLLQWSLECPKGSMYACFS